MDQPRKSREMKATNVHAHVNAPSQDLDSLDLGKKKRGEGAEGDEERGRKGERPKACSRVGERSRAEVHLSWEWERLRDVFRFFSFGCLAGRCGL